MSSQIDESRRNVDPRDAEISQLRGTLDEVSQQLLEARDLIVGAEMEVGAAKARVREVEHQLHVTTVEVEELRDRMALLAAGEAASQQQGHEHRSGPNMAKRLSPLLGRNPKLVR